MPAQAVQDPACARHAGAQAQRVPAPLHAAVPSWKTGCKEQPQPVAGAARHFHSVISSLAAGEQAGLEALHSSLRRSSANSRWHQAARNLPAASGLRWKSPEAPRCGKKAAPEPDTSSPAPPSRATALPLSRARCPAMTPEADRLLAIFFPPHLVHLLEQTGHGDTAAARAWQSLPCGMHRRQQHLRGTPLAAVPCPPPPKPAPAGPAEPSRSSPSASSPAAAAPR